MTTFWSVFAYVFWFSILYGVWKFFSHSPSPSARRVTLPLFVTEEYLPSTVTPRVLTITAPNPHAHPYQELSLDDLLPHLYDHHFECWNLMGDRDLAPRTYRRNHAEDHGLMLR